MQIRYLTLLSLALLVGGCAHDTWTYRAVPNIPVTQASETTTAGPLLLNTHAKTSQTVLMATWHHESDQYNVTMGRTLVVILDGQLKPGQYWLTPDNCVLLTYSAYSAPSSERVAITGSINIQKVEGNKVVADLAVHDSRELDSAEFIERPYDPTTSAWPFELTGQHEFAVTDMNDPIFEKSEVKWVKQ